MWLKYISNKTVSDINIFFTDTDTIDDDYAYCLKCLRLRQGDCACLQCNKCLLHYADIITHKCNGIETRCVECCNIITSSSNKCYFCESDEIIDVCKQITPTFQYNLPQCLRCLSNIQNNKPCTCKQCSDCLIYYV